MPEYIEREAAIKAIENQCVDGKMYGNDNCTLIDPCDAIDEINSIPAADVAPVRHRCWIKHHDEYGIYYECSGCREALKKLDKTPFCPHCGAKMDLGEWKNEKA